MKARSMMRSAVTAAALTVLPMISTASYAAIIRVDFSGIVGAHSGDAVAAMPLGTAGSGYFIYDTTTPATHGMSDYMVYDHAVLEYAFSVGGYNYSTGSYTNARMHDENIVGDRFDMGDWNPSGDQLAGHDVWRVWMLIGRPSDGVAQGLALPEADWFTAPDLIAILLVEFSESLAHRYQVEVQNLTVTDITGGGNPDPDPDPNPNPNPDPTDIPAPAGLGLLGLGVFGGLRLFRRRK